MKRSDLSFSYPPELVATEPQRPSRVMWCRRGERLDLRWREFLREFRSGDLIVVNDTKVTPSRVWCRSAGEESADILFVRAIDSLQWEVLAPFKKMKGLQWQLPEGVDVVEITSGIPQVIKLSRPLSTEYFLKYGEVPLPPYILKTRGDRHSQAEDSAWYQSIFAQNEGSSAAPTASLHFTVEDFDFLKSQGVEFAHLTLHVGLGTYLPVTADNLDDHRMHSEEVNIPIETWRKVQRCEGRVFALGTTVARALESALVGKLKKTDAGFSGSTDLLIQPGYDFKIVRGLLTNFHQPESTLLALVAAFAGLENVRSAYAWAVAQKFRLFSYGDLTVWESR